MDTKEQATALLGRVAVALEQVKEAQAALVSTGDSTPIVVTLQTGKIAAALQRTEDELKQLEQDLWDFRRSLNV